MTEEKVVWTNLILPGHPLYQYTLDTRPPPGRHQGTESTFYLKDYESGILRPAGWNEAMEYLMNGEYEAVKETYDPQGDKWQ